MQSEASCPPRQEDNVIARFKHVEPIGETPNVLDALSEIGRLVVCARRSIAGPCPNAAEPTYGGAPTSPSMVLKVRLNACGVTSIPSLAFISLVHFDQLPITAPRAPGRQACRARTALSS